MYKVSFATTSPERRIVYGVAGTSPPARGKRISEGGPYWSAPVVMSLERIDTSTRTLWSPRCRRLGKSRRYRLREYPKCPNGSAHRRSHVVRGPDSEPTRAQTAWDRQRRKHTLYCSWSRHK